MTIVYFDLVTTGLNKKYDEVIQVGARCGRKTFSRYVLPKCSVHHRATRVHGLFVDDGRLWRCGQDGDYTVRTVSNYDCWMDFIDFLDRCGNGKRVALAAHRGSNLDFPILMRSVERKDLREELLDVAGWAIDTLDVYPRSCKNKSLVDLAYKYDVPVRDAHEALGDIDMMRRVVREMGLDHADLWDVAEPLEIF